MAPARVSEGNRNPAAPGQRSNANGKRGMEDKSTSKIGPIPDRYSTPIPHTATDNKNHAFKKSRHDTNTKTIPTAIQQPHLSINDELLRAKAVIRQKDMKLHEKELKIQEREKKLFELNGVHSIQTLHAEDKHSAQMLELKTEHSKQLLILKNELGEQLLRLNSEHSEELLRLDSEHNKQLVDLKSEHRAHMLELGGKKDVEIFMHKDTILELRGNILESKEKVRGLKDEDGELKGLRGENRELKAEVQKLRERLRLGLHS